MDQDPRVVVLLGAGASADAGVPLTSELAKTIVSRANIDAPDTPATAALNFVYGSMVGHRAADGGNPMAAVNIETLVSALRLLSDRESHEVAPFVATWRAGADGFGTNEIPRETGQRLVETIADAFGDSSGHGPFFKGPAVADLVAEIAVEATRTGSTSSFQDAEHVVLDALTQELTATKSIDYLGPLLDLAKSQLGGLDVISLNYDMVLQTAAAAAGLDLDVLIDRWVPGEPLTFRPEAQLRLIKAHGSIDWSYSERGQWQSALNSPEIVVGLERSPNRIPPLRPWIVVGDREKLATEGPTLALFHAAFKAISRASHLVVIGYSFTDSHINALIRDWMNADERRTMTVLDPGWPRPPRGRYARGGDQRLSFTERYGRRVQHDAPKIPRLLPIELNAAEGLERALTLRPGPDPDPYFDIEVKSRIDGDARLLDVRLMQLGPRLDALQTRLRIDGRNLRPARHDGVGVFISNEDREKAMSTPLVTHEASRRTLDEGESWDLFLRIQPEWTDVLLVIHAETSLGLAEYPMRVPLPSPEVEKRPSV